MTQNVNLFFFKMERSNALVDELWNTFENKEAIDPVSVKSVGAFSRFTKQYGVFVFSVKTKKDLQEGVAILKQYKDEIKLGVLKPVCISFVKNPKIDKILHKYQCKDVIDKGIQAKSFGFKIDFWFKNIFAQLRKSEKMVISSKSKAQSANSSKDKVGGIKFVSPLELEEDFWLTKKQNSVKMVLGRWMAMVQGPSSLCVSWEKSDSKDAWELVQKSEVGKKFIPKQGKWFFSGDKPDFDWKAQRWVFKGKEIALFYTTENGSLFKIKTEEGGLKVAEDSIFAKKWEEEVLKTFDSEYSFDKDETEEESKDTVKNEAKKYENLKGDVEEEELIGGPLKGKSKTDEIDAGPLSGDVKENEYKKEGKLKGTLETAEQGIEDLLSYNDFDVLKQDEPGGVSLDQSSPDDLGGKVKQVDSLSDLDGNTQYDEGEKSDYGGDVDGTDELDSNLHGKINTPDSEAGENNLNYNHDKKSEPFHKHPKRNEIERDVEDALGGAGIRKLPIASEKASKAQEEAFDWEFDKDIEGINFESGEVSSFIFQDTQNGLLKREVLLDEIYEEECIVSTRDNPFKIGDLVKIEVQLVYDGQKAGVMAEGILEEVNEFDDGDKYLFIKIEQIDMKQLGEFMKLYQVRQSYIENFMNEARGVA